MAPLAFLTDQASQIQAPAEFADRYLMPVVLEAFGPRAVTVIFRAPLRSPDFTTKLYSPPLPLEQLWQFTWPIFVRLPPLSAKTSKPCTVSSEAVLHVMVTRPLLRLA